MKKNKHFFKKFIISTRNHLYWYHTFHIETDKNSFHKYHCACEKYLTTDLHIFLSQQM